MNSVQILGNLARDPEVRFTKNAGRAVASFTVAASDSYVDSTTREVKERVAYINCVAWGNLAEQVGTLRKGSRAFVEGRLQTRSYEAQDGTKRYVTEVVANFVGQALDKPSNDFGSDHSSSNFDNFGGGVAPEKKTDSEEIPF